MSPNDYPRGEVSKRAKEIYERSIRSQVEKNHWGEYLVIDIETGEYELDKDHLAASERAFKKNPEGMRFAMRIGYPAMGHIGFNLRQVNN